MKNILRWISTVSMILLLNACGGGGGGSTVSDNPTATISGADFGGQSIVKELPNGESYTISDIQEVLDIPTVAGAKVYTTKIDGTYDGFFVVNGDSVEGTFTKGGTTYSVGTFKDGQHIEEAVSTEDGGGVVPPTMSLIPTDTDAFSAKYRAATTPEVKVLFVYNEDFWNWCDKSSATVDNKLQAMLAYTNVSFSRSGIHATVSLAGSQKRTLEHENENTYIFLNSIQPKLADQSDDIYQLREQYHADIVFVIKKVTYLSSGWSSGRAYYSVLDSDVKDDAIQKSPEYAIGVQDITTNTHHGVFAHELGHIFGCRHDYATRVNDGDANSLLNAFANGYWFDIGTQKYTTLMGYTTGGRVQIQNFSNPTINYDNTPTGIAGDGIEAADCARFINFSAPFIADFRGTSITPVNTPPVANAGTDIVANEKTTVNLNGSASSDKEGAVTYLWSQTSGTTVTLNNTTTATPSFIAPSVDSDSVLEFKLVVTDSEGATSQDTVVVTVKNTIVPNQSPTANAGLDQSINENTTATLNGSGTDSDGWISGYQWTQISGTTVSIVNANSANASFTAPNISSDTTLTFRLTVTDNSGATATDIMAVNIKNIPIQNQPPIANAGSDQSVNENTTTTLNGSGTDSDGWISGYQWTQISGTTVSIVNANSANASFTAPNISSDTTLTFRLTVTDNSGATATDDVVVSVTSGTNNNITQFISNLENNTTNLSQFIDYGGAIYVLTTEDLDEVDYRSDPDGTKSYKTSIFLTKIVNGNITSKVEIDKLYSGSLHSAFGALNRGAIGISGDKIKIVFNEKDEYTTNYGQTGYIYLVDPYTIEFTKETLFTQANWGWYPYIDSNGDVIHFSFAGYYLYKNSTYLYNIAPTVASKDMQNTKIISAGQNGNLTVEIPSNQLAFDLINYLKSKL